MAAVTSAVVGIGTAVASTGMSFANAAKQKRAAEEADKAAKQAMLDAKTKASKDFYEGLNVPLDAYEAEFENNLAVAQQNTEALQEGDARALAAGVGRIGAASAESAENTRIAMGQELSDLQATKAQSKDAVNQQLLEMDVAYAKEQNQRKNAAEAARAQSIQQGIQGIGSTVTAIGSAAPLFGKSKGVGQSLGDTAAKSSFGSGANSFSSSGFQPPASLSGSLKMNQPGGLSLNSFSPKPKFSLTNQNYQFGGNALGLDPNLFGSDRRLKENIEKIGVSPSGLNIYSFKYKDQEGTYQGVMSDEVPKEAVVRSGVYDMVNYAMIDVEFKEL